MLKNDGLVCVACCLYLRTSSYRPMSSNVSSVHNKVPWPEVIPASGISSSWIYMTLCAFRGRDNNSSCGPVTGHGLSVLKKKKWPWSSRRRHCGSQILWRGKHKIVVIKKIDFLFCFSFFWVVNFVQSFKVPCSKNFVFWYYCLFVPEQKSSEPFGLLETILCFPDL